MKSFPSTFVKNPLVHTSGLASTLKGSVKNILQNAVRQSITGDATTLTELGEGIDMSSHDPFSILDANKMRITDNLRIDESPVNCKRNLRAMSLNASIDNDINSYKFENVFKPTNELLSIINNYNFIFTDAVTSVLVTYTYISSSDSKTGENSAENYGAVVTMAAAPSLFNPYNSINIKGITTNVPLLSKEGQNNTTINFAYSDAKAFDNGAPSNNNGNYKNDGTFNVQFDENFTINSDDCSINNLVKLSKQNSNATHTMSNSILGWNTFRYIDFMYCRDLGKISNNHLLVLRKFAHPVSDNITTIAYDNGKDIENTGRPIGKLISWFGNDENKLEDICSFEYNTTYKTYEAKIEQKTSQEDKDTPLANIINLASPNYRSMVAAGRTGSNNGILKWAEAKTSLPKIGPVGKAAGQNEGHEIYTNYDNNKVYTPKNTIQDNHIYEGVLKFQHSFTVTFSYKLRAYDNINPRSAFMDLIGNILEVTYQRGTYWAGSRQIVGPQQNASMWKRAMSIIDKAQSNTEEYCGDLVSKYISNGSIDFNSVLGEISNYFSAGGFGQSLLKAYEKGKEIIDNAANGLKSNASTLLHGVSTVAFGMLKNRLGRPQMYAFQSLIGGEPVGYWHLTVGNPLKPILTMGNLILEKTKLQHKGPLGIDDFPTEIVVTCTLKHAKSRDIVDISRMYTQGRMGIYMPLDKLPDNHFYGYNIKDPRWSIFQG